MGWKNMSIPYTDWLLLAPYPAGDSGSPPLVMNWLHFDLTKASAGKGWIAWNTLPPDDSGIGVALTMPPGATPVQVTYNSVLSLVTIS